MKRDVIQYMYMLAVVIGPELVFVFLFHYNDANEKENTPK